MNQAVYDALVSELKTTTGLYPLQEENTNMLVGQNKPFSRATMIYTRPETASVGRNGRDHHAGLFQVDLFVPLNSGTVTVNALADDVIAVYPRGLTLDADSKNLHVIKAFRETAGRFNDQFHKVSIVVEWRVVA